MMNLKSTLLLTATAIAALLLCIVLSVGWGVSTLGQLQDEGYALTQLHSDARDTANLGPRLYQVIADAIINRNLDESGKKWNASKQNAFNELEGLASKLTDPALKQLTRDARTDVENLAVLFESKTLPLLKATPVNMAAIGEVDAQMDSSVAGIRTKLEKLSLALTEQSQAGDKHFDELRALMFKVTVVFGLVALTLMAVMQWRSYHMVFGLLGSEPQYAVDITREIAQGNLSISIKTDPRYPNSLLHAMAGMRTSLREIVAQLQRSARALATSSQDLSATATTVSSSADTQSSAASSMAAAIEELTVSINLVAENTRELAHEAEIASERSENGAHIVAQVVEEMDQVAKAVSHSAAQINALEDESRNIANVINVIREVADQTNLLALNAAIEAARAGEQGRGFAVVADEVRKLAERTGKSTTEITSMVGRILSGTDIAVKGTEEGAAQVAKGVELVNQAGTEMSHIQQGSAKLISSVNEISVALREQGLASNQIATEVERVAQMAEENTSAVSSVVQAVSEMRALADEVGSIAARFRV
jgi:methyl-accepting chemotaxis protein